MFILHVDSPEIQKQEGSGVCFPLGILGKVLSTSSSFPRGDHCPLACGHVIPTYTTATTRLFLLVSGSASPLPFLFRHQSLKGEAALILSHSCGWG